MEHDRFGRVLMPCRCPERGCKKQYEAFVDLKATPVVRQARQIIYAKRVCDTCQQRMIDEWNQGKMARLKRRGKKKPTPLLEAMEGKP